MGRSRLRHSPECNWNFPFTSRFRSRPRGISLAWIKKIFLHFRYFQIIFLSARRSGRAGRKDGGLRAALAATVEGPESREKTREIYKIMESFPRRSMFFSGLLSTSIINHDWKILFRGHRKIRAESPDCCFLSVRRWRAFGGYQFSVVSSSAQPFRNRSGKAVFLWLVMKEL